MKKIKFKDFIKLQRGFDLPRTKMRKGHYPVVGSTSIIGYHDQYKIDPPGVITGRSGSLGIVQYVNMKYWPHNTVLWVKDFKENIPLYVYYYLNILPLARYNSGAGVPTLNRNHLENLDIYIHGIPTQKKISKILSNYDHLIENNLRRIKILEEMAQLIYHEWFVNFRFPGHEKVKMVDSAHGKIPEGWDLKSAIENPYWSLINKNIKPYKGTKRYFATADINGIEITGNGIEYTYKEKPSRAQKEPLLNSVWFARMQETYKIVSVSRTNCSWAQNSMLSSGFAGFKANDEDAFVFLFLTVNSEHFHKQKDRFCTGATQRSLNNEGLSRILTLCPPEDIIKRFASLVTSMTEMILVLQNYIQNLRQTRDLLLPQLITGKLDVSDLDIKILEEMDDESQ
jgi:type I restriction enzyme, S subunit